MGPVDVSLALGALPRAPPGVELTVREQSSEELAEMVRDDELDLAFLSVTERVEGHGLGLQQLVSEELVLVVRSAEHRLARRRRVRMGELAGEEFISYREGARLRELLVSAGRDAGFEPRVTLESNESERIRRLVARGPRRRDPAAVRRGARRVGGRGGGAGRAEAAPRHHAGLARGPAAGTRRGRVPGGRAGDLQRRARRTASGASTTITSTRRDWTATMNVVFAPAPNATASTA